MNKNYSKDNVYATFSLIRNFLQLLSVANTDDLPKQSVFELSGMLIKNIDFLSAAYEELLKENEKVEM